jgi:site-specific DNA recombinase
VPTTSGKDRLPVALYCRISLDRKQESESPERQAAMCRSFVEAKGWTVGDVFIDRDTSAYKKVPRPALDRLWVGVEAGKFSAVCVWKLDRLTRRFTDAGAILKRLQDAEVELVSVTDNIDTTTPLGQAVLGIFIAQAETESKNTSLRVSAAWEERAAQGKPHVGGRRCFGFTKDMAQIPAEAKAARWAVDRLLAGDSANSVSVRLNERGVLTGAGKRWHHGNLRQWVQAPALAGIRTHRGVKLPGDWKPIITVEEHEALLMRLGDARPANGTKPVLRWLLTGVVKCGACGGHMSVSHGRNYGCDVCHKVYAARAAVDAFITEKLFDFLSSAEIEPLSDAQDPGALRHAMDQDERSLTELSHARWVTKVISDDEWRPARDALVGRLESTKDALAVMEAHSGPELQPGNRADLQAWWTSATIEQQRAAIRDLFTAVIIKPTGRTGCKFNTDRVVPIRNPTIWSRVAKKHGHFDLDGDDVESEGWAERADQRLRTDAAAQGIDLVATMPQDVATPD